MRYELICLDVKLIDENREYFRGFRGQGVGVRGAFPGDTTELVRVYSGFRGPGLGVRGAFPWDTTFVV